MVNILQISQFLMNSEKIFSNSDRIVDRILSRKVRMVRFLGDSFTFQHRLHLLAVDPRLPAHGQLPEPPVPGAPWQQHYDPRLPPTREHDELAQLRAPREKRRRAGLRHGERSRSQLHFQLGGPENVQILAVNLLAVNVLAVNRPVPLHIVSKSVPCTLHSAKKRVTHPI